jgi:hypothetical protein
MYEVTNFNEIDNEVAHSITKEIFRLSVQLQVVSTQKEKESIQLKIDKKLQFLNLKNKKFL